MLLTISTTGTITDTGTDTGTGTTDGEDRGDPADLGYVLHKHPERVRTVSTTGGQAHVFWPEVGPDRASVAMLVEIDPVGLVRRGGAQPLAAYVNDRPYVASSFLSVAMGRLFRSALNGDCPNRPELAEQTWALEARLPAVPVVNNPGMVARLFGPLGYDVDIEVPALDPHLEHLGQAPVASVTLRCTTTVRDLLRHLYVLLPVLDNDKHYWIDEAEVEKLLRHGEGWLADHPEQHLITGRYLGNYKTLTALASGQLTADAALPDDDVADSDEASIEKPLSLNDQRLAAVVDAVAATRPSSVIDMGCGEGKLLGRLADDGAIQRLVGLDVSTFSLRRAARSLRLDSRPERQTPSIELRQSSLTYRDVACEGFDVACLVEVIEHLDLPRLDAVEPILFKYARPATVIITTPNREYNELFPMPSGSLRHRDHRFEWTRDEFAAWCERMASTYGYGYEWRPIGPVDPDHGPPTQMAILTRHEHGRD